MDIKSPKVFAKNILEAFGYKFESVRGYKRRGKGEILHFRQRKAERVGEVYANKIKR